MTEEPVTLGKLIRSIKEAIKINKERTSLLESRVTELETSVAFLTHELEQQKKDELPF